ncbi:hypothetical protein QVD17_10137 [Tagetes erecta]|uniref:Gnk2-homologous domain-containing protein n=1 Tax=Tagetes erecta TaxID=13708 RepID=A0AAD8L2A3_TARER|nr:hypothetical protein QVD17_10137 [Tagetes erecta]
MQTKYLTSLLMFLVQVLINSTVIAQKPEPNQQLYKCNNIGDLKSDALVKARDSAFFYLIRNMGIVDPYNGYAYGNAYGMYSIGLCPPNIKKTSCLECLNGTIPYLKRNCPKQKEGVAWAALSRGSCIVRYADTSISRSLGDWAWMTFSSPPNESFGDAVELRNGVNDLANNLRVRAAGFSEDVKFAFGSVTYKSGSRSLYGSMQCTPGIQRDECMKCLNKATDQIHNCCTKMRKKSGRAMSTNCYFRYSHIDFTLS